MDDLFGKDDSDPDSDAIDIDETDLKDNTFEARHSGRKDSSDGMEVDGAGSLIKTECDAASSKSLSDLDGGSSDNAAMSQELDDSIDIVKHEIDLDSRDNMENPNDQNLDSVIILPHPTPMTVKERRESKEKSKRELEEEEREKMQVLVSNFTEDQLDRYEMYRRAAFPKAAIKRIMQTITGCSVSQNVVIAMSGIAKVFVGEIVEEALDVMETNEESGPLQPKHLREAVRRLRLEGQIPNGRAHKAFFRL